MKFLIDMPISPSIAHWLRDQGHEAMHASQKGMSSASDIEILKLAQQEKSIIITADLDFPRLIALGGERSPAVILFRGGNYKDVEIKNLLQHVLEVIPPQAIEESIVVVDKTRIRKRRLPVF